MTAVALRRLPLPDVAPSPDLALAGEPPGSAGLVTAATTGGQQGVLRLVLPGGDAVDDPDDDVEFGPQPTARRDLPDPLPWSRSLVQVLLEVLSGHRPCTQLLRWTSQEVYETVRSTAAPVRHGSARPRHRPAVRSVRVCEPADGVAEVSAVVGGPGRAHALALRLEGRDGRWRVTAMQTA